MKFTDEVQQILNGPINAGVPCATKSLTHDQAVIFSFWLMMAGNAFLLYLRGDLAVFLVTVIPIVAIAMVIHWLTSPEPLSSTLRMEVSLAKDCFRLAAHLRLSDSQNSKDFKVNEQIRLAQIKAMHPFVFNGWLFCKARGFLLELHDGNAFFIALKGKKNEVDRCVEQLNSALQGSAIAMGRLRTFQR
ncbi:hypothetical protein ACX0MV_17690 [Pseudomonas borbori]